MPSGAHIRTAMIADRAEHARLQVIVGDLIGKPARVANTIAPVNITRSSSVVMALE
jgi:hypothetical protein